MYGNQMVGNEDDYFEGRTEEEIDYTEPYEPEERAENE